MVTTAIFEFMLTTKGIKIVLFAFFGLPENFSVYNVLLLRNLV